MIMSKWIKGAAGLLGAALFLQTAVAPAHAEIAATHVYHNHMPNFWAYYDTSKYASTAVGSPIRYMYDGDVIELKKNPPAGYNYYLPSGAIMPHDDLVSYYSTNAKTGAYLNWPWNVANSLHSLYPSAQMQVTMSGAVVNNVNNIIQRGNVSGYTDPNWGTPWKNAYDTLKTPNGNKTLDMIHFSGHHSMGPLVGNDYLLKDLIYQGTTLSQNYFLGSSYRSSNGYFPTELGFSERIIPVLEKLGIKWSVVGNNHFSRTLQDYPLLDSPGTDTLISPPNRADLQNVSTVGSWVNTHMFNEQQNVYNKYPFASTPHWVGYVNPTTGTQSKVVGVPVAQAESWEEGYQGSVTAGVLKPFEGLVSQKQFFVIAHDGDNSSGRAGAEDTWRNAANVTYADSGVKGMGIDEYLVNNTPAASDIVHVQDGSWIDTRDSSSDPTWYHWHLPFGIWKAQFADFNRVTGLNLAPKTNLSGVQDGMTVSLEYGYHYLERNYALLQAAENYAKTAEQIWLDDHPNYWQPTTTADHQLTYNGNQLNPYMLSFPVKGNPANDYAGGANPAELAWYFLLPAMDSGFGYYDENQDDSVKPTLSFNQSLYFSKPYVTQKLASDRTGPSIWWPQRYPYNPGSANVSKAEGWTLQNYDNTFAIYTYGYDTSGISNIKVKVRTHTSKTANASDNTFKVYDPAALQTAGVAGIDATKVGAWQEYPMQMRDLSTDINGVDWQASSKAVLQKVPATDIGNLYYTYLSNYRDQLLDYYIEATDAKGNVTRSDIQQVYVGAGKYDLVNGKYVENVAGAITGTHPFITDQPIVPDTEAPSVPAGVTATALSSSSLKVSWTASTDNKAVTGYDVYRNGTKVGSATGTTYTDTGLTASTAYSYTVKAFDAAGNNSALSSPPASVTTQAPDTTAPSVPTGIAAVAQSSSSVMVSWTASTDNVGVTGYEVYRNGTKVGTATGTTYTDTGLAASTTYSYTVKAYDAAANLSAFSAAALATTSAGNNVTIYYKQGFTTPYIHYRPVGGTWTTTPGVAMPASEVTGYNKITINIGTATQLEACFNNGSGTWDSNNSQNYLFGVGTWTYTPTGNIVSGGPFVDTTAPTAPGSVTATASSTSAVSVNWTASTDNVAVTGYDVYRGGVKVGSTGGTVLTYADTGLTAGTTYSYTVKAFDAAGNYSAFSAPPASVTTKTPDTTAPSVPTNVAAVAQGSASVLVSWTASTDNVGVTGYEVYRNGTKVGTATGTTYTDTGLAAGTTYSYTVKAYDAAANLSASSAAALATTAAGNNVTIYYKQGYTTPYIHYRPVNGTWTTSPGVAMPAAEVSGYNKITINIGTATQLEACFNNGSGTWDSNNSQNYLFGVGTWTYTPTGNIVSGGPVVDTQAPTVPGSVAAAASSAASVSVSWTASTDNVAVTGYDVYRGGVKIGSTTGSVLTYIDTTTAASTTYSYTVKALDAAGNVSAASAAASVTTPAGNSLTVYYKNTAYTNTYIYYKLDGQTTWTTSPGVQMAASSAYAGYKSITIQLGSATGITAAFNNGSGTWDNNGSSNYHFDSGVWSLVGGSKTAGEPQADSVTFRVTVPSTTPTSGPVYLTGSFNSWAAADAAYQLTKGTDGVYSITLNLTAGTAYTYKFTRGTWANVEVTASGSDISNRTLTPSGGAQTVALTVARWKDL